MDKSRLIGYICAAIALMLLLLAGKGCAESITVSRKNADKMEKNAFDGDYPEGYNIIYPSDVPTEPQGKIEYDIFGRPIIVTEPPTETETALVIETVTDQFGNVIEEITAAPPTEPEVQYVTDVFGNIEGTVPIVTDAASEESTETTAADLFGEHKNKPPAAIGGYNHGRYDDEGNLIPTIPPDFYITVD